MHEATIIAQKYLVWCHEYDNSTELSARAVFLLWMLDRWCKGQATLPMPFPLPHGNLQPVGESDPTFANMIERLYVIVDKDSFGKQTLILAEKGRSFLSANEPLCKQLDTMSKDIDRKVNVKENEMERLEQDGAN